MIKNLLQNLVDWQPSPTSGFAENDQNPTLNLAKNSIEYSWQFDLGLTHPVGDPLNPWMCSLTAQKVESLSCLLTELRLFRSNDHTHQTKMNTPLEPTAVPCLDNWANAICKNLNGVIEELKIIETDLTTKLTLIRSSKPARKPATETDRQDIEYFEMILQDQHRLQLNRYRFVQNQQKRVRVPFVLSRESIAYLFSNVLSSLPGVI